eukprot:gb/GECG01006916.1/.p1 GENE.gb/GECG01006916.1/~~gb/GECG01006916.1/.p1  ORF type:complete len:419 (+),score=68.06 gb/GECG01006916.1/:1-1257(+)
MSSEERKLEHSDEEEEDYEDDFEHDEDEQVSSSPKASEQKSPEGANSDQRGGEAHGASVRTANTSGVGEAASATAVAKSLEQAHLRDDSDRNERHSNSQERQNTRTQKETDALPVSFETLMGDGNKKEVEERALWNDVSPDEVKFGPRIGGGGFALVYKGTWKGKSVAIKSLFDPKVDEKLKQEFMDELHVMRQLSHPAIVEFKGASTTPPHMFFLMELCKYGSLFSLLHEPSGEQKKLTLDDRTLVQMATDVASAIEYLHGLSPPLIHRDIKSHNLLVTNDLRLKLCDFGLVATRNTTAGTPNYMAPELLTDRPFSKAVDVYSFGILLWEMWSCRIPFSGWRPADIRDNVSKGERPDTRIIKCPDMILQLMKDCWQQDHKKRPDISTVAANLRNWKPQQSNVGKLGAGDALDGLMKK